MYNISDFLLVPVKIKCTQAVPPYSLFFAGSSKKSEMLYKIYIEKLIYLKKKIVSKLFDIDISYFFFEV